MTDLSLAIQKEVLEILASKAVIINGKGGLYVDGTPFLGLDGERSLKLFTEGVERDVAERGHIGARNLYRERSKIPGSLGNALRTSDNLSRMLDAEEITKI